MPTRIRPPCPNVAASNPALPSTPGAPEHGQGLAWDNAAGAFAWATMGGGGGSSDHATLTHLDWPSSGHAGAGGSPGVAAFDSAGAASEVQATADETMLVRRAGILQWIPLLAAFYVVYEPTNGCVNDEAISYPMDYTTYVGGTIT